MTIPEIIMSCLGTVVAVYVPMLIRVLRDAKEEMHKSNVLNEKRLSRLETMMKVVWTLQSKSAQRERNE
jgi:hypothetical protein